jgi:hypothetical protein
MKAFLPIPLVAFAIFSQAAAASDPIRARIVDEQGQTVGEKTVYNPRECGRDLGPALLAEGKVGNPGRIRVDCSKPITPFRLSARAWPGSEVRTLVRQGPVENRIDLTIVGDGYTESEKAKFFDDAEKIVQDLFGHETFATYLPLFNVHAVYVPSRESGVGDGRPKDTALRLYRHATIRQAVMPSDSSLPYRATQLAPGTDYPILVANDRFYGGLGGAYAITTSSPLNRTTVLRHELGHNFGRVGEEYDGGQAYMGANFSSTERVPWAHWARGRDVPVFKAQLLHYSAPWQNLGGRPWEQVVQMPPSTPRLLIDFSSVGFDTEGDVGLVLSGKRLRYTGAFNYDRNFYQLEEQVGPGRHSVRFEELVPDRNNILSKVAIYALPPDYPSEKPVVGAFLTYREGGSPVGYRPTHDKCLMRDMKLRRLCGVCVENIWQKFLSQVSLIDSVGQAGSQVEAKVIPLGLQRLKIDWMDPSGKVREDLSGKLQWPHGAGDQGAWKLRVQLVTPEIRHPSQENVTVHVREFRVN